ncbi:MAG TPA: hypothetical protein VKV77_10255 [Methylovirgula sp.]|nr:hypothetical protein [Methylovirgula sp.]
MNTKLKAVLAGAAALGLSAVAVPAVAMPSGLDSAVATPSDLQHGIQKTFWVCRPWGCHWAPYWGPRWGYGWGWGWHRPWHRWWW